MTAIAIIDRVRLTLFRPLDANECYRDDLAAAVVWHAPEGADVEEGVRRVMRLSASEARYLWAWTQDEEPKATWAAQGLAILFAGDGETLDEEEPA